MIKFLMVALISSAMMLNGSDDMASSPTLPSFATIKEAIHGAKDTMVSKFTATATSSEAKAAIPAKNVSCIKRFFSAIKNIKIVEPAKNGVKYVFSLPVNGVRAAWNSSRSTKVKAAIVLAAIAGGSYAAYTYYQSAVQEADNK